VDCQTISFSNNGLIQL